MKKVFHHCLVFMLCASFLFFSCEATLESDESDSGELLLSLYANYDEGAPVFQHFSANTFFRLKKNPFTRPGYTFLGWTDAADSSFVLYDNRSEVEFRADKNLYAVWQLNTYTVSYQTNGGKRSVIYPEEFTILKGTTLNPVRNGKYTFGGWYENKNFTGKPLVAIPAGTTGDKTVYARWCGTVLYHLNGGQFTGALESAPADFALADESSVATEETPAAEDEPLADLGEPLVAVSETETESAEDAEIVVAEREEADRPVDFAEDVLPADDVVLPFEDADDDTLVQEDGSEDVVAELVVADETQDDDTAETLVSETVSIDAFVDGIVQYYTIYTDVTLPVPVREDYDFCGWYYDEAFENPADDVLTAFSAVSLPLYAKWKKAVFSVTYCAGDAESGEPPATEKGEIETSLTISANDGALSREGYRFAGWLAKTETEADSYAFYLAPSADYTVTSDVFLYPAWQLDFYAPVSETESDALTDEDASAVEENPLTLALSASVIAVGDGALQDMTALQSIDFGAVQTIGARACKHTGLTAVDLSAVTDIGDEAFAQCRALQTVVLPEQVPALGKGLWADCADGLRFVVPKKSLSAYKKMLTPAVVGKKAKTYTIVALEEKAKNTAR